jgi:hypothetical protein
MKGFKRELFCEKLNNPNLLGQRVEVGGLEGSQYPNHYPCRVVKNVHKKC